MAPYTVTITLTTNGVRNPRTDSAYEVVRADGRSVKVIDFIRDDPQGFYAKAEGLAAAERDAEKHGVVLQDGHVLYLYRTRTVEGRRRRQ